MRLVYVSNLYSEISVDIGLGVSMITIIAILFLNL